MDAAFPSFVLFWGIAMSFHLKWNAMLSMFSSNPPKNLHFYLISQPCCWPEFQNLEEGWDELLIYLYFRPTSGALIGCITFLLWTYFSGEKYSKSCLWPIYMLAKSRSWRLSEVNLREQNEAWSWEDWIFREDGKCFFLNQLLLCRKRKKFNLTVLCFPNMVAKFSNIILFPIHAYLGASGTKGNKGKDKGHLSITTTLPNNPNLIQKLIGWGGNG